MTNQDYYTDELKDCLLLTRQCCNNDIAKTYIEAMPSAIQLYGKVGLRVQLIYILSNLQYWRGEVARQNKTIIKKYIKLLK